MTERRVVHVTFSPHAPQIGRSSAPSRFTSTKWITVVVWGDLACLRVSIVSVFLMEAARHMVRVWQREVRRREEK